MKSSIFPHVGSQTLSRRIAPSRGLRDGLPQYGPRIKGIGLGEGSVAKDIRTYSAKLPDYHD
ncbi:unnamed protein product [Fusarium graminearum]|uniref:Chromosome 3, complete genome n=2 Tax=Gibberella zeae TaxID=5518 RepID=A0A098E221_GIBZE|nr:unnamed protein product [Fusarium graminearum]CAF3546347.1 unnamed protein product [Fusarium graminearum]CAG1977973.1 unnamed protein product [Fusarium graminearum]CAG2007101.1 unnamed protein product [Fusarium graminearum]CEF88156.1 unnamed protein product [Fusarium graminearum]